ncbi:unnamed protein product [Soboliphyme baturini]|uniref:Trafficking protein particle complex subunit 11 n=1 Tax=Soboliphyme baturini TaxID=241478 RepID=A0A183IPZ3_9BILA|nr:unnamed protein product [Soboliphyme baturini]
MTGLPALALYAYNSSIDCLKAANDFLWLAGAYEGSACAAATLKYGRSLCSPIHRVSTYSPGQLKDLIRKSAAESPYGGQHVALSADPFRISFDDIITHFRFAIENYQKFSFAVNIECECVFKALWTLIKKGARICCAIAEVYKMMSFNRKMAFYLRLAAVLRSNAREYRLMTSDDYRIIYYLLLQASDRYLMSNSVQSDVHKDGWMDVRSVTVLRLDDDLLASEEKKEEMSVFIYTPIQMDKCDEVHLVARAPTRVEMRFANPLSVEVTLQHLKLRCDGVDFEHSGEVDLVLSPHCCAVTAELCVTPMHSGVLVITGYSCDLFGVQNTCRLEDLPWLQLERPLSFEVLSALPLLRTRLLFDDRGPNPTTDNFSTSLTTVRVYCGQKYF